MSETPSLHKLVVAISNAVLQAQEKVETAQLNNLMSYFYRKPGKKGYFPLAMKVNLPSLKPGAEPGDTEAYRVPYLSVLPYSSLRIKRVDVDFDVAFGGLGTPEAREKEEGGAIAEDGRTFPGSSDLPNLSIDMGSLKNSSNVMAHVKLCLEGVDVPEGTARLINELIKTNQTYEPQPETPRPVAAAEGRDTSSAPTRQEGDLK